MGDRRFRLVKEIYDHSDKIGANRGTMMLLLAVMTDKELTKFHKEFLTKEEDL